MNWLKLFKKRVRLQTDTKGNSVVWVFKCVKYKIAQTTTNAEGKSCPYWEEVRERIWGIFSDEKKCLSWCAINISDYEDGYYNIGILEPVKIDTTPYCFNLNTHFFYYSAKLNKIREINRPPDLKRVCGFTIG